MSADVPEANVTQRSPPSDGLLQRRRASHILRPPSLRPPPSRRVCLSYVYDYTRVIYYCILLLIYICSHTYMTSGSLSPNSASPLRTPRAHALVVSSTTVCRTVTCPTFYMYIRIFFNQFHNPTRRYYVDTKITFNRCRPPNLLTANRKPTAVSRRYVIDDIYIYILL